MRLSDLQLKEIVNISNGKRVGRIIDVNIGEKGNIINLVLEDRRGHKFSHEEYSIQWNQIVKIGDDIILVDTRNK